MQNTNLVTKTEVVGSEIIFHVVECYGEIHWTAEEALSIARPLVGWSVSTYASVSDLYQKAIAQGMSARFKMFVL